MRDQTPHAGAAGPDLALAVTVFVTTVGAPTFDTCMARLRRQDCRFTLRVIDHIAPMHLAFQRMLDECRTPYYVQVDEDMLLHPHAVRTLHERIEAAGVDAAMYIGDLYDAHLQRCIHGVKIYRHAIVRHYPFAGIDAFESWQVAQLEADGYAVIRTDSSSLAPVPGDSLGVHGTQWTPESIYERYTGLERRRQAYPPQLSWFGAYPSEFLARFLRDPTELNFFALMGVLAGALGSRHGGAMAKDYRTYEALPGFAALRQFLTDVQRRVPANGTVSVTVPHDGQPTDPTLAPLSAPRNHETPDQPGTDGEELRSIILGRCAPVE